jgi:arylamine N-acetyltransferase
VPPLDPEAQLRVWEAGTGGGVCFEAASAFARLLAMLGYRVQPVLAQISFPGSHQACVVELDGRRWLVDVAQGSPLFEPMPLDRAVELSVAGLGYRSRPGDAPESWTLDRWSEQGWTPFCHYPLGAPSAAEQAVAYQSHHVPGRSFVVSFLRLVRLRDDEVWSLRGDELTHFKADGKRVERVGAEDDERLAELFGAPRLPIAEARAALAELLPPPR